MYKQWIGAQAQNFQAGRGGFSPEAVVLHRLGGSLADLDARCAKPGTFNSSHYAIGADGTVHQYVEERDTAFHAGLVVNPTWPLVKSGRNPNFYTVGIELAGTSGEPVAAAQYDAAAALIAGIAARWNFPPDASHIVPHSAIRAGRDCPGSGFEVTEILGRIAQVPAPAPPASEREVRVLRAANVREGAPSTSVRIARVSPAGTVETVAGFTDQGERVSGNSYWYRTLDGNYLWAGGTDCPHPEAPAEVRPAPPPAAAAPVPAGAPRSGIPRIDQLFAGGAPAITEADTDRLAIGAVQDLLSGLGFAGMPTVLSSSYGTFGPKTRDAVTAFRQQQGLNATLEIGPDVLQRMIAAPAPDPRCSSVYLAFALGFSATGMARVLSLVSQMEGAGRFAALNRNTDRAGLSFGLIQWAQRPGRLAGLLVAMSAADRDGFVTIFGGGNAATADALIAHCGKPWGGVDLQTGETVNPSFDLVNEPWVSRFRQAALTPVFQQAQVRAALEAMNASHANLQRLAPELASERAVGFMLDVANQFGDAGTVKLYTTVRREGMSEQDLLEAIADLTVEKIADAFKAGVRARRDHFLETGFLTDDPFVPGEPLTVGRAGA